MGFATRAEQDSACHGGGCMSMEDEIKRLGGLVESLDQTIEEQNRQINALRAEDSDEIKLLRQEIADVNASFAAIRESNERLRQERAALTDRVAELGRQNVDLERQVKDGKTDTRYWLDQYKSEQAKAAAYEKVIRMLAGKE